MTRNCYPTRYYTLSVFNLVAALSKTGAAIFAALIVGLAFPCYTNAQAPTKNSVDSVVKSTPADSAEIKAGTTAACKENKALVIYEKVDVQAKFPGGDAEWRKYLERNYSRDLVVENGAPPGNYTVVVSFVVTADGSICEVKAENNPGFGAAEEAVKVIRKGPNWIPAMKNGKYVASKQRQVFLNCLTEE